jgi:hypothetical protein
VSFEVFVQCFEREGPGGVPRAAIRPLFPVAEAESEPDYWAVRYDDLNSCHARGPELVGGHVLLLAEANGGGAQSTSACRQAAT